MRKQRSGCIVNISSLAGLRGFPALGYYNASKFAEDIVKAVASGQPPHHLLLGNNAFDGAMARLDHLRQDFVAGKAVARAAEFPKPKAGALS